MSETDERPILLRLETFWDDFDAFYGEAVPMLAACLCADASDEITRLTARIAELEKALKPFAAMASEIECAAAEMDEPISAFTWSVPADNCINARTTLSAASDGGRS